MNNRGKRVGVGAVLPSRDEIATQLEAEEVARLLVEEAVTRPRRENAHTQPEVRRHLFKRHSNIVINSGGQLGITQVD